MPEGLDVIVMDDDPEVCEGLSEVIKLFYSWGDVVPFTDFDKAVDYCRNHPTGLAVFVVDVFLGDKTGFTFLDTISEKFPMAYEDAIIVTGAASEDVVNMCIASGVNHLLEKPIREYALQFAVRAIVTKYIKFARKIIEDPDFADNVAKV
ncbi:MAG TPA: response regulator [Thermodesulfobacteriota bacterium]|nr:response regulator [Thermodesulfobacteriota bacterium]